MWESTGEGYYSQPNCSYRKPPSQPNVIDGFIYPDAEKPTKLTDIPFLQQSNTKNVLKN